MIARDDQAGGDNFIIRFPGGLAEIERIAFREGIGKDERFVRLLADAVEIDVRCAQFEIARSRFGQGRRDEDAFASLDEPIHVGDAGFERGVVRRLLPGVVVGVACTGANTRERQDGENQFKCSHADSVASPGN